VIAMGQKERRTVECAGAIAMRARKTRGSSFTWGRIACGAGGVGLMSGEHMPRESWCWWWSLVHDMITDGAVRNGLSGAFSFSKEEGATGPDAEA
jgi:hypothetical protein